MAIQIKPEFQNLAPKISSRIFCRIFADRPNFWTRHKAGNASEDEIEHINNGNDFEIEDIGTFDEPEKSKPTEKTTSQKSTEKSTSKSSEKVDSESEEEVEIVKDSPSEAFWFLEDGVVKSSKDVPTHFKARVSS